MKNEVAEVKEKTDIVAIIGEHVTLKKAGRHFKGLCPFHGEKSPSFIVSPELQMYKCFGCGESGDVFTFLEKFEGLEFPDALKILADRAGVKLTPFSGGNTGHKDILYEVNETAARYYQYVLLNLSEGKEALDYLTSERKLTKETIKTFMIGVSLESPSSLFTFLTKKKGYKPEVILEAGLVYKTDRGSYVDRFRGRIIFPIQNSRGAIVALAGRILPSILQNKKDLAKYINSPETPIYKKSESLFGISIARNEMKRTGVGIVVEGELDMISPWQNDIKNIVAIKGSALTESHARLLSRLVKTVILALDSDFAGNSAAIKGITLAQNAGLAVKVADLGKYKDPDEFAKADPEGFRKALEAAEDAWEFVIGVYFKRFNADTPSGKAAIGKELVPHIAQIADSILRAYYIRTIASRLGVPEDAVTEAVRAFNQHKAPPVIATQKKEAPQKRGRRDILEEQFLVVGLLTKPELLIKPEILGSVKTPKVKKILAILEEYLKTNEFLLKDFTEVLPMELREGLLSLLLEEGQIGSVTDTELTELAHEIRSLTAKEEILSLTEKIKDLDREGKDAEILELTVKIGELTKVLAREG